MEVVEYGRSRFLNMYIGENHFVLHGSGGIWRTNEIAKSGRTTEKGFQQNRVLEEDLDEGTFADVSKLQIGLMEPRFKIMQAMQQMEAASRRAEQGQADPSADLAAAVSSSPASSSAEVAEAR